MLASLLMNGLFFFFAVVLLAAAIFTITAKNPVYAVLSLMIVFVNSAMLWILIEAEFLSLILIIVYVGAVVMLFLFVAMMLDMRTEECRPRWPVNWKLSLSLGGFIAVEVLVLLFWKGYFAATHLPQIAAKAATYSNTKILGLELFTSYIYPFELAAVVLLLAMVAAIALTHRPQRKNKAIEVGLQVAVNAEVGRLKMVDMKSDHQTLPASAYAPATPKAQVHAVEEIKSEASVKKKGIAEALEHLNQPENKGEHA